MIDPDAEREILAAMRSSCREDRDAAFDRLCRIVHAPVLGVCVNIAGQQADGEDAFQETLLAVRKGLATFRGDARLGTWIWRIAIRAAVRQRATTRRHATPALDADLVDPATERREDASADADRIDRAMVRLSVEHRTVLALFCVEEASHEEIAAALGVPVGTVWSRLHHARKQLAAVLDRPNSPAR